jgi:hypothetical protein
MIVACAALLVALGGTGFAALKLPKNSVGAAQLRNGAVTNKKLAGRAVTAAKVAPKSLTGAQIKSATLGLVPSATHAVSADTAAHATSADTATSAQNATHATSADSATVALSLAAPEDLHLVGAPGEPAFQHSWQNRTGTADEPLGFYKDRAGVVHLQGRIINGSSNNSIFQLPAGYRPASGKVAAFPATCECTGAQTTMVTIEGSGFGATGDGAVTMENGNLSSGNSLFLDGISFLAAS